MSVYQVEMHTGLHNQVFIVCASLCARVCGWSREGGGCDQGRLGFDVSRLLCLLKGLAVVTSLSTVEKPRAAVGRDHECVFHQQGGCTAP